MIHLNTKFHTHNSNGALVFVIRPKTRHHIIFLHSRKERRYSAVHYLEPVLRSASVAASSRACASSKLLLKNVKLGNNILTEFN
jgi:hypothetical protein